MKITLCGVWEFLCLLARVSFMVALLVLAYAYVTDTLAFHQGQFELLKLQTQALMKIADELHGTRL